MYPTWISGQGYNLSSCSLFAQKRIPEVKPERIEQEKLSDLSDTFFDEADDNKDGAVSLNEFRCASQPNLAHKTQRPPMTLQ